MSPTDTGHPYYSYTVTSIEAHFPRKPQGTILPSDRLRVAYARYVPTSLPADKRPTLNLVFAHGTGMNKSVWRHHIDRLYTLSHDARSSLPWRLGTVVAMDHVGHGDSCVLNEHKLGEKYYWGDGGRDLVKVLKHEGLENRPSSRTIGIGHSLGGHCILYAGFLEPGLFDSIIAVDPVIHHKFNYDPQIADNWKKHHNVHRLIEKNMRDLFDSVEECVGWFKAQPAYANFHPSVFEDFVKDEIMVQADKTVKTKSTVKQQVVAYASRDVSYEEGKAMLPFVTVPVLHLIGSIFTAFFTAEGTAFVRKTIPHCTGVEVPGAGHLVHCDRFEETVAHMITWLSGRALAQTPADAPQTMGTAQRAELFDEQFSRMWARL